MVNPYYYFLLTVINEPCLPAVRRSAVYNHLVLIQLALMKPLRGKKIHIPNYPLALMKPLSGKKIHIPNYPLAVMKPLCGI